MDGLAELKALSKLIQDSVEAIEASISAKGLTFPSSTTPFSLESEAGRNLPEVAQAGSVLVAAATQLITVARSPMLTVTIAAQQHALSAALGIATQANAAEAIREAGPQGARVNDIARASNIDPSKLARVLRVLATNHIFVEAAPDVFVHNRVSSVIDTGKSVQALKDSPETKHVGTFGIAAGIGHVTDEAFKASAHLGDVLLDPKTAKSDEPNETALNKAFGTTIPVWEWFEDPSNAARLMRFGITMEGSKQAAPPDAILHGFEWKDLNPGAIVVDVGGGIGGQSMTLAQNHSQLKFVVQDREPVVRDAAAFWDGQLPGAIKEGRVVLQAHDFFTAQPVKNADVFLLRMILHDWADKYCVKILRQLREAATSTTRLVIVDNLISYACPEDSISDIPGAARPLPPTPLLANLGQASAIAYYTDMQMMELLNGKERTITQVRELMKEAGWKLVQVHHGVPFAFSIQKAIAVPA
ncbi:S-adenosyl-L-methionine-dependent methyltransferase [Amylostereum chailletii]|nr:S-adenosyl-L-methionine-dependent methyltransferase [Amylostereum chailletii]